MHINARARQTNIPLYILSICLKRASFDSNTEVAYIHLHKSFVIDIMSIQS